MLTPRQAWRKECRWCSNTTPDNCNTTLCLLSTLFEFKSTLRRIKAHCEICNGDDHAKDCTGHQLRENGNTERWYSKDDEKEFGLCFLHPYRLGKNPKRKKRTLTLEKRVSMAEVFKKRMAKHRTGSENPGQDRLSYGG